MTRFLSELIFDDLCELANFDSDYIASEEAIRFMLAVFAPKLHNIQMVHVDDLYNLLKHGMATDGFLTTPGHYQLVVEVDQRSLYAQRVPVDIHYFAVDIFVRPGKKPLLFMADHYRGHDESGYYLPLQMIVDDFDIQLAMVGGRTYQADLIHCMIFTIQHLLLTAQDDGLLALLDARVADEQATSHNLTRFDWFHMPAHYLLYAQSVKGTLFNYIDFQKELLHTEPEEACSSLQQVAFDTKLASTLSVGSDSKVYNVAVKFLANQLARDALRELVPVGSPSPWTEDMLLALCYEKPYPDVYHLLRQATTYTKAQQPHPLLELAFYHAQVLALCLKHPNFSTVFHHAALLENMYQGKVDPRALFEALTKQPRVRKTLLTVPSHNPDIIVDEQRCDIVLNNLWFLDYLAQYPQITQDIVLELLLSDKLSILTTAVTSEKIPLRELLTQIRFSFASKNNNAQLPVTPLPSSPAGSRSRSQSLEGYAEENIAYLARSLSLGITRRSICDKSVNIQGDPFYLAP